MALVVTILKYLRLYPNFYTAENQDNVFFKPVRIEPKNFYISISVKYLKKSSIKIMLIAVIFKIYNL